MDRFSVQHSLSASNALERIRTFLNVHTNQQKCPNLARFGKARNISHGQVMPIKMLRQSINALSIAVLISQGLLRVFPSDGCLARHYKTDAISYGDQWKKESFV